MDDPDLISLLRRVDAVLTEVRLALRAELAGAEADEVRNSEVEIADDPAADTLIEISTAMARFNRPADSLRWMCRTQGCGVKVGGRWMCSPAAIARYLNGG